MRAEVQLQVNSGMLQASSLGGRAGPLVKQLRCIRIPKSNNKARDFVNATSTKLRRYLY